MPSSKGRFIIGTLKYSCQIMVHSGGAVTLNDMKDMLASLPQYQEQREAVYFLSSNTDFSLLMFVCCAVLFAHDYGSGLYGHFWACQPAIGW